MTHPSEDELQAMRRAHQEHLGQAHGELLAAQEQMWLELARALAAGGVLDAHALAQRLEEHAQRAPHVTGWFYGLLQAAQWLRAAPCGDPDSLVQ